MKIIIAGNKNLETHNLITKFIRIFTIPLLNSLPSSLIKKLAKKSSEDAKGAIENAASAYAVEILYTRYNRSLFSRGILQGIADLFWHHIISQAKALRNRLKIVEDNLLQEIVRLLSNNQKEINILSVAGGSLRAIIHSIDKLHKQNVSHKIKIINIDKDPKAIELGKKAASELAVDENFTWINDDAKNIKSLIAPNSVYIVEMIGLLDYLPEEKGIEIIKQIYNVLKENGILIVGNIHPNPEMVFVEKTGWPKMYYRTPDDLSKIIKKAGFAKDPLIIIDPLKVHIIAIARK